MDAIGEYVAELSKAIGAPFGAARVLAEAEAHLRDAASAGRTEGLDEAAAQRRAVERFGPAPAVAASMRAEVLIALDGVAAWAVATGCAAVLALSRLVPAASHDPGVGRLLAISAPCGALLLAWRLTRLPRVRSRWEPALAAALAFWSAAVTLGATTSMLLASGSGWAGLAVEAAGLATFTVASAAFGFLLEGSRPGAARPT